MGKYQTAFRLALSRMFIFRSNLVLGMINVLFWFGTLVLLYRTIGIGLGEYSVEQLTTYILGTSFLAASLFYNSIQDQIANEIVEGDLTNYLLRPVNYFGYWVARALASRLVLIVMAAIAVAVLSRFVAGLIVGPVGVFAFWQTLSLTLGAFVLITLLDFTGGLLSFWTGRGFGPRWMLMLCARFLSGAALPIALMPAWAQTVFHATPFPSLIAAPVEAYLGRLEGLAFTTALLTQWVWIIVIGLMVAVIWHRGLKSYAAYGS